MGGQTNITKQRISDGFNKYKIATIFAPGDVSAVNFFKWVFHKISMHNKHRLSTQINKLSTGVVNSANAPRPYGCGVNRGCF